MVEIAAHLVDHVFPPLPVRQWVLTVPKRLRYFLQHNAELQGAVLRIFLREVEHCLLKHSTGCDAKARLGAVAFIQRFGSSLNEHLHFHCCIMDGVFDSTIAAHGTAVFHQASTLPMTIFAMCKLSCGGAYFTSLPNADYSTRLIATRWQRKNTMADFHWMHRYA